MIYLLLGSKSFFIKKKKKEKKKKVCPIKIAVELLGHKSQVCKSCFGIGAFVLSTVCQEAFLEQVENNILGSEMGLDD